MHSEKQEYKVNLKKKNARRQFTKVLFISIHVLQIILVHFKLLYIKSTPHGEVSNLCHLLNGVSLCSTCIGQKHLYDTLVKCPIKRTFF